MPYTKPADEYEQAYLRHVCGEITDGEFNEIIREVAMRQLTEVDVARSDRNIRASKEPWLIRAVNWITGFRAD